MAEFNRIAGLKQKKGMPEYGKLVCVHGTHCWGDWKSKARLIPYKIPPFKNGPVHRFVSEKTGGPIKFVEGWSEIK